MRAEGCEHRVSFAWPLALRPQPSGEEAPERGRGAEPQAAAPARPNHAQPRPAKPRTREWARSWVVVAGTGVIAAGADQDGETPRRIQPSACVIGEKGLNEKPGRAPTGQRSPSASAAGHGAGEGESRTGAPALEARASGWLQASAGAARRATVPEAGRLSRGPRRGPHSRPAR